MAKMAEMAEQAASKPPPDPIFHMLREELLSTFEQDSRGVKRTAISLSVAWKRSGVSLRLCTSISATKAASASRRP